MKKLITELDFETYKKGFNTIDCTVRDRNIFYFVLRENYTSWPASKWDGNSAGPNEYDIKKRMMNWLRKEPVGDQWGHTTLTGVDKIFGEVCFKPKSQFVGFAEGQVYAMGSGDDDFEKPIPGLPYGGPFQGSPKKARRINGWLYATGGGHCVGKRVASGQWQSFTKKIPDPKLPKGSTSMFHDIDGFSEDDIYCAGSYGVVCHFDGKDWLLKSMPTNVSLQSLCCAGDGFVYVSGMHGATFKGRGDKWKTLYKGSHDANPLQGMVLGFKDMVWYEDRVWCTSDYGLWTIKDDKLEEADVPDFVRGCSGNLSAADGVLLLAGYGGAAFKENGQWQQIY